MRRLLIVVTLIITLPLSGCKADIADLEYAFDHILGTESAHIKETWSDGYILDVYIADGITYNETDDYYTRFNDETRRVSKIEKNYLSSWYEYTNIDDNPFFSILRFISDAAIIKVEDYEIDGKYFIGEYNDNIFKVGLDKNNLINYFEVEKEGEFVRKVELSNINSTVVELPESTDVSF